MIAVRMSLEEREAYIERFLWDKCLPVLSAKGIDYSAGKAANSNFDRIAEAVGVSRFSVWAVFFQKHVGSILSYLKGGTSAEPIDTRIADAINYLLILASMIHEEGES
jgi:hypothetical protein